jgi:hypothetical protein
VLHARCISTVISKVKDGEYFHWLVADKLSAAVRGRIKVRWLRAVAEHKICREWRQARRQSLNLLLLHRSRIDLQSSQSKNRD